MKHMYAKHGIGLTGRRLSRSDYTENRRLYHIFLSCYAAAGKGREMIL